MRRARTFIIAGTLGALAFAGVAYLAERGPSVSWSDYAPGLQARIDGERAAQDCAGLQQEFDNADAGNAATLTRTGHNNADLMDYINEAIKAAGCPNR